MQKISKSRGITLILLVITIIVLIILAGVTIGLINGNDGILSKTKLAQGRYQNSANEENEKINTYENEIDKSTIDVASSRENTKKSVIAYQATDTSIINSISISNYNIYDYDYILITGKWSLNTKYVVSSLYKTSTVPIGSCIILDDNGSRTYYTITSNSTLEKESTSSGYFYLYEIDLIKF